MDAAPRYWFPARRYGWGWGFPATWEGWLVLVGYLGVVAASLRWLLPVAPLASSAVLIVSSLVFVRVCVAKGEPPRWRWGGD